jgi:uncharacterized protein
LLEKGADVNQRNQKNVRPLMISSFSVDRPLLVSLLLDHDADPILRDTKGYTVSMTAVHQGHTETTEILVKKGKTDTSIKNAKGQTALHVSAPRKTTNPSALSSSIMKLIPTHWTQLVGPL